MKVSDQTSHPCKGHYARGIHAIGFFDQVTAMGINRVGANE
jgi:hypothetical protein